MPAICADTVRRVTPWEEIGQDLADLKSPAKMLERTGLNWTVHRVALHGELKVGRKKHIIESSNYALVRDRDLQVLSEVPENWQPIQNIEAFRFFAEFCKATGLQMTRAGSLKKGQLIWAMARMPDDFFMASEGDRVQSYLLFTNRHEYGTMMDIRLNPIRALTKSSITMALNKTGDTVHRMGHMVGQEERELDVADADEIMGKARKRLKELEDNSKLLVGARYRPSALKHYFDTLFPAMAREEVGAEGSKAYHRALELVETLPGADLAPQSWWNAFITVCYMCDSELGQQDPSRLYSAWYGPNKDRKKKAMHLALQAVKKS